jgi:2-polyprenyl-6-methoxyphenol hydroxylase-like FAD-dependent oxidoreductase
MPLYEPDSRYDAVIAGARVAGAATALLLARAGLRVLVVDPVERGRDTLSTHALMRGGVMQLSRWGLLDAVRDADTPRITRTTFHYEDESIAIPIEPHGDVDGLYAPRRTVLDTVLIDAAGVVVQNVHGSQREVRADVVIGADGVNSKVARILGASPTHRVPHSTASIYGYWKDIDLDGYHWYFGQGAAAGVIPTNHGESCVFVSLPPSRLLADRDRGLETVLLDVARSISPDFFLRLMASGATPKLRGFAGSPSLLREAAGAGWALVGDAGYFKDPLTAHGITDALIAAELLARAIVDGCGGSRTLDDALIDYQTQRDSLARGLLDVTSRIASLEWTIGEVKSFHRTLSREMKGEVEAIRSWDSTPAATRGAHRPAA